MTGKPRGPTQENPSFEDQWSQKDEPPGQLRGCFEKVIIYRVSQKKALLCSKAPRGLRKLAKDES